MLASFIRSITPSSSLPFRQRFVGAPSTILPNTKSSALQLSVRLSPPLSSRWLCKSVACSRRPFSRLSGEFHSSSVTRHRPLHCSLPTDPIKWDPLFSLTRSHMGRRPLLGRSAESGIRNGIETPFISNDAANRQHVGFLRFFRHIFPPTQLFRRVTCRRTGTLRLRHAIPYESSSRDYQIFFFMSFSMTSFEASFSRIRLYFSPSARAPIAPFIDSTCLPKSQFPRFSTVPIPQQCVISSG